MAFPVVVPFGMVADYRQPVMSLWKTVSGAVVTAVMYTLASGLMIRLLSAMLQSTMPLLLVVAVALGLTVALLVKLRAAQVIRTIAGVKIARNLSRDRTGTDNPEPDENEPGDDGNDGPANPGARENTPAPTPPAPAGELPPGTPPVELLAAPTAHSAEAQPASGDVAHGSGRGSRRVIDARLVAAPSGDRESVDSRDDRPGSATAAWGDDDPSLPGSSGGVAGPIDPRAAVWYMGPPGTNAGEPYYLPASPGEEPQHRQRVSPRAIHDDHVAARDESGRPVIEVYEPDVDRGRKTPPDGPRHPRREER
jgi:hypothetical protein